MGNTQTEWGRIRFTFEANQTKVYYTRELRNNPNELWAIYRHSTTFQIVINDEIVDLMSYLYFNNRAN